MNSPTILKGGSRRRVRTFSTGNENGSVSVNQFVTLCWTNADDFLLPNDSIEAPTTFQWGDERHGYYISEDYILREIHVLWNVIDTLLGGNAVVQLRKTPGSGSPVPVSTLVYSMTIPIPVTGGAAPYYGYGFTGLSVSVPGGNQIFNRYMSGPAGFIDGISIWAFLEKDV